MLVDKTVEIVQELWKWSRGIAEQERILVFWGVRTTKEDLDAC